MKIHCVEWPTCPNISGRVILGFVTNISIWEETFQMTDGSRLWRWRSDHNNRHETLLSSDTQFTNMHISGPFCAFVPNKLQYSRLYYCPIRICISYDGLSSFRSSRRNFFEAVWRKVLWTGRGSAYWGRTICLCAHYQTFVHTVSYKTRLDIIQTYSFISYYIWHCIKCWCLHVYVPKIHTPSFIGIVYIYFIIAVVFIMICILHVIHCRTIALVANVSCWL